MIAGGFLPSGSMGNTETLFGMVGTKLKKLLDQKYNEVIFLFQVLQEGQMDQLVIQVFF